MKLVGASRVWRGEDHVQLLLRGARGLSGWWPTWPRLSRCGSSFASRCARRGSHGGRTGPVWPRSLLHHVRGRRRPCIHPHGQGAEPPSQSGQDLGSLRPAYVLSQVRAGPVRVLPQGSPAKGTPVSTPAGDGVVSGYIVTKDAITVRMEDGSMTDVRLRTCQCQTDGSLLVVPEEKPSVRYLMDSPGDVARLEARMALGRACRGGG